MAYYRFFNHSRYTREFVCSTEGDVFSDVAVTSVEFEELTRDQIHRYHQTFNLLDKAGAYAVQKGGSIIVKRIEGCYYNVMGLPLQPARRVLSKIGINLWDYLRDS